jgi:antitoxin component YwqK of YwqJK toxin-antitoxin module
MKNTLLVLLSILIISCQTKEDPYVKEVWPNGKPKTLSIQVNGVDSYTLTMDSLGQIERFTPMKQGKTHGAEILYTSNAQLNSILNFKDGERNGYTYQFFPDGMKSFQGFASDGGFNGISTWYYTNGQILETGIRNGNKKDGEWVEYFQNGVLKGKGTYTRGKKNQDWQYWNMQGLPVTGEPQTP